MTAKSGSAGSARSHLHPHPSECRLSLKGADFHDGNPVAVAVLDAGKTALVDGRGTGIVAVVDGRAAGQQGVRTGRPAVERQVAQPRVNGNVHRPDQVARGTEPGGIPVNLADQVVPLAEEGSGDILLVAERDEVPGDDRVLDEDRTRATGLRNHPPAAAGP